METLSLKDVSRYVEENIGIFHEKRIQSLDKLELHTILKRKNPYLFRAKNILTAEQIIKNIVDAHISSHEETVFGSWLEGLAIFISHKVYGGRKSGIQGIDLELDINHIRYIITIKSGPSWGNSSQIARMRSEFMTAKKTLRTSNSKLHIIAINGCCYGKDNKPDKGDYFKYCGQQFWEFISNDSKLFTKIIGPLGHKAKEKNDSFLISYAKVIDKFTEEFASTFCKAHGKIDWDELVRFNSGL